MTIPDDRTEIWLAMANQFLDSEERTDIPHVALKLVEAGLTVDEAHRVWMYEVAPALGANLWSVAGVWGAWEPELVLTRVRASGWDPRRHHVVGAVAYLVVMAPFLGMFRAIGESMAVLSEVEGEERARRALDLEWLARQFFDFAPRPAHTDRQRLARTYEACFHRAIGAAIVSSSERAEGEARVRQALAS